MQKVNACVALLSYVANEDLCYPKMACVASLHLCCAGPLRVSERNYSIRSEPAFSESHVLSSGRCVCTRKSRVLIGLI